jgi:hypothetical protein
MGAQASRGRKRKRDLAAQAGVAIPGLPFDVAVSLVEKHLPDPADLAVLRAVSKGMRAAVDATGLKVVELDEEDAAERGYMSTLKCLRRRGRLFDERLLCAAAARIGDLEALKALRRAGEFPVGLADVRVRGVGRPLRDAEVGARERLPLVRGDVRESGEWRPPRGAEVAARERLPVGRADVHVGGSGRKSRDAEMGARE